MSAVNIGEAIGLLLGGGVITQAINSFVTWMGKGKDVDVERARLLSADEKDFRKALLDRIEQLEKHDRAKTETIREQHDMIQQLEGEVRALRLENDQLRRGA